MTSEGPVKLIPFRPEHIYKTFEWVSDPDLRRQFLIRGEISWPSHQAYFERILADPWQRVLAIVSGDSHVGNCGLKNLSDQPRDGELWIYIGDASLRQKGIGRKATELLVGEGFQRLGLDRIYLHVADFNLAARKMYQRLGFLEVPLQGDDDDWSNRGCTVIRMELKKSQWTWQ